MFSYELFKGRLPSGIASLFEKVGHSHNTRGAERNIFVTRSCNGSMMGIAPKFWNALPVNLRDSPSLASFEEGSKKSFLNQYSAFSCDTRSCSSCAFLAQS